MKTTILIFFTFYFSVQMQAQTRQAFVKAGDVSMEEGDYYTAGTYFTRALEFNENDAGTLYKLAEASRLYNDYEHAAVWYEKYLETEKKSGYFMAVFYLAEMKKYQGLYEMAKTHFRTYYENHIADSNFFSLKSFQEMASCDSAVKLKEDSITVNIVNAGNIFNSVYSDFGALQLADSVVYFSSQRFLEVSKDKKKKSAYLSKILKSKILPDGQQSPEVIDRIFNPSGYLNCNASISTDYRLFVFSRCTPLTISSYHAELYLARYENNKWQAPVKLGKEFNNKNYNATQPCVAVNGANGYILFFSSDRPGGFGGMDLWKSNYSNGRFSEPENLGSLINTRGDEITPFFDHLNSDLYFSSDWHAGLGGYDIFKAKIINNIAGQPVNAGFPINSSCNDLYFTIQQNGKQGLLTSNRPGSMYLHTQTCCYDIYKYNFPEIMKDKKDILPDTDSLAFYEIVKRKADSIQLSSLLPLKLYFDNDQPGKRSLDTVVAVTYEETYYTYIAKQEEYLKMFRNNTTGSDSMQNVVKNFFKNEVEYSYINLEKFSAAVLVQLNSGRKVMLTIQGCASPLANAEYNRKLSKRRISSLVNYFKQYQDGSLVDFINSNKFVIFEDAAGESLAGKKVSDNFHDKLKSVYHPDASIERRIEAVSIKYIE